MHDLYGGYMVRKVEGILMSNIQIKRSSLGNVNISCHKDD